jgi:hypothetical protein
MSLKIEKSGNGVNISGSIRPRNAEGLLTHLKVIGGSSLFGSLSSVTHFIFKGNRIDDVMYHSVEISTGKIDITFYSKEGFKSATTYLNNCGELSSGNKDTVNRFLSDFPSGKQYNIKNEL